MIFVKLLTKLLRDKKIGKKIVPVVPDEARTFGMDGLFRQFGIYSSAGQKYEPEDSDQIMFYKETKSGVLLEEGINEAGAFQHGIGYILCKQQLTNDSILYLLLYVWLSKNS